MLSRNIWILCWFGCSKSVFLCTRNWMMFIKTLCTITILWLVRIVCEKMRVKSKRWEGRGRWRDVENYIFENVLFVLVQLHEQFFVMIHSSRAYNVWALISANKWNSLVKDPEDFQVINHFSLHHYTWLKTVGKARSDEKKCLALRISMAFLSFKLLKRINACAAFCFVKKDFLLIATNESSDGFNLESISKASRCAFLLQAFV